MLGRIEVARQDGDLAFEFGQALAPCDGTVRRNEVKWIDRIERIDGIGWIDRTKRIDRIAEITGIAGVAAIDSSDGIGGAASVCRASAGALTGTGRARPVRRPVVIRLPGGIGLRRPLAIRLAATLHSAIHGSPR